MSPITYIDFPRQRVPRWFLDEGVVLRNGKPWPHGDDIFRLITLFGFGVAFFYRRNPNGFLVDSLPQCDHIAWGFSFGRFRFVPA